MPEPHRTPPADTYPASVVRGRHPARWAALAVGIAYTLIAVAGFVLTGLTGFIDPEGEFLFGLLEVNPLHNLVHLVVGVAGLAMWRTVHTTRLFGWILLAVYAPTFWYGMFIDFVQPRANILALNNADNLLHMVSALAGLGIALWSPASRVAEDTTEVTPQR